MEGWGEGRESRDRQIGVDAWIFASPTPDQRVLGGGDDKQVHPQHKDRWQMSDDFSKNAAPQSLPTSVLLRVHTRCLAHPSLGCFLARASPAPSPAPTWWTPDRSPTLHRGPRDRPRPSTRDQRLGRGGSRRRLSTEVWDLRTYKELHSYYRQFHECFFTYYYAFCLVRFSWVFQCRVLEDLALHKKIEVYHGRSVCVQYTHRAICGAR